MATEWLKTRAEQVSQGEANVRRNRLPTAILGVALLASMGPYLGGGLRTEQVALYASVLFLLPVLVSTKYNTGLGPSTASWAALAIVNLTVSLLDPPSETAVLLAGLDAVFLPLAAMCVVLYVASSTNLRSNLIFVQRVTILLLVGNSLLSMAMLIWPQIALLMEGLFWTVSGDRDESNALLVYGLGRVIGIFHSPFGAGVAYSAAIVIAIYLLRVGEISAKFALFVLPVLIAGGVLTQSKVVYFVGLPCALVIYLLFGRARKSDIAVFAASLLGVFALARLAGEWTTDFVMRWSELFQSSDDFVDLFTAGRISENSAVQQVQAIALDESPVYGLGARGALLGALDTSWTEAIVRTGLIGLACAAVLVLLILYRVVGSYLRTRSPEAALGIVLSIILVAAMFGGPTFTLNRVGTIMVLNLWILMSVLYRESRMNSPSIEKRPL